MRSVQRSAVTGCRLAPPAVPGTAGLLGAPTGGLRRAGFPELPEASGAAPVATDLKRGWQLWPLRGLSSPRPSRLLRVHVALGHAQFSGRQGRGGPTRSMLPRVKCRGSD